MTNASPGGADLHSASALCDSKSFRPLSSWSGRLPWLVVAWLLAWAGLAAAQTSDFGDAAAFAVATQTANSAIRIGSTATDAETASPANAAANGDDWAATDDEDLIPPSFIAGSATAFSIPVTVTPASLSGSTARLNVYVDWNGDGDVSDAGETQAAQTVNASGSYTFNITPPAGTSSGTKWMRLRLAEGSSHPGFSGLSTLKGEVEDYPVVVGGSIGNLVWIDTDGDGVKDADESGQPGVVVQLWRPGSNGIEENGGGDDVKVGADLVTDLQGQYLFTGLSAGGYYVRLPSPPAFFPVTAAGVDAADNQHNDDNNGQQPQG